MDRRKLSEVEIKQELAKLKDWQVLDGKKLYKKFDFRNFQAALDFVNRVGARAEAHDHHPDIRLGWGYAEFEIMTHDRGGLTDFDFALAGEIDEIAN
jgi:4a-hydroxytetrahydrobiopterin dehydratase